MTSNKHSACKHILLSFQLTRIYICGISTLQIIQSYRQYLVGEWVDGVDGEWVDGVDGEWVDGVDGEWVDGEWVDGVMSWRAMRWRAISVFC